MVTRSAVTNGVRRQGTIELPPVLRQFGRIRMKHRAFPCTMVAPSLLVCCNTDDLIVLRERRVGDVSEDWVFEGTADRAAGDGRDLQVCERCGWPRSTCACQAQTEAGGFRQPRPPLRIWYACVAILLVGVVLSVGPFPTPVFAVIGWLLVGPAAVLIFGRFTQRRTAVSSIAGYGEPAWLAGAVRIFPVVVIVAVAVAAWPIADWVSRR